MNGREFPLVLRSGARSLRSGLRGLRRPRSPNSGGTKIILDIHDIVPEFYAAKFGVSHQSAVFRGLKLIERLSSRFADHVIAANDIWLAAPRGTLRAPREECTSFINYPDPGMFHPGLRTRPEDDRFIISYPGTLELAPRIGHRCQRLRDRL